MGTNSTAETKVVLTRMTETEYRDLTALADRNDRSIAAEVRRALRAHLKLAEGRYSTMEEMEGT